jgi:type IV pilus assembly protein PilV
MRTSISGNAGFTLIEVLIAVFVLTFGVISVAAMQLTSLRLAQQTTYQSTAVQLASELADIMRAHPTEVDSQRSPFYFDYTASTQQSLDQPMLCYGNAICNEEQSARFQLYEWRMRLKAMLPGARTSVCRDSTPWNVDVGSLTWYCNPNTHASIVIKIGWAGKGYKPDGTVADDKATVPNVAMLVEVSQSIQHGK